MSGRQRVDTQGAVPQTPSLGAEHGFMAVATRFEAVRLYNTGHFISVTCIKAHEARKLGVSGTSLVPRP